MNTLIDIFKETMEREGINITIDSSVYKVFLRRNDKTDSSHYSTLYAYYTDDIKLGSTFILNGNKYIILKRLTSENTIYQKYTCVMCNATIKWIYGTDDLIIYDVYMKENIQDSLNVNSNGITTSSKGEFLLSLNQDSRRIGTNGRFYCGAYLIPWKVTDINYLNGLVYLYSERTTVLPIDDTENGIAERWNYETKPGEYVVDIKESIIEIEKNKTQMLTVTVSKDGSIMSNQPTIEWVIDNNTICSIDNSNIVTGLAVGTTKVTGSYKVNKNDIIKTDSVNVTVTEPQVEIGEIEVNPLYDYSNYYGLLQGDTQIFTCLIGGVSSPQWNITLNPNGIASTYYTSSIDNGNGSFTIQNKKLAGKDLIYTITELSTGKTAVYNVRLKGVF